MPFLQLATGQIAGNHLSCVSGVSSKMVPTLTENCLRGVLRLALPERPGGEETDVRTPAGRQATPLGQRSTTLKPSEGVGVGEVADGFQESAGNGNRGVHGRSVPLPLH